MRRWMAVVLLLIPSSAFAWGAKGHRIIADVAERELGKNSPALKQALALLGVKHLADVASLPDDWTKKTRTKHTTAWHFVNIPITNLPLTKDHCDDRVPFDEKRDCDSSACVVGATDYFLNYLIEYVTPPPVPHVTLCCARDAARESLIYLIHFVGDLHQPMHCATGTLADGSSDNNGTLVMISVNGGHLPGNVNGNTKNNNLHFLWDVSLIEWEDLDEKAFVKHLFDHTLGGRNAVSDFPIGPVSTVAEYAHKYAECTYKLVSTKTDLNDQDMDEQAYYADEELLEAGLGLANAIRRIYKSP